MLRSTHILFSCLLPTFTAVSVKIDGVIDLGANWNYKYTVQALKDNENILYTQLEKRSRNDETSNFFKLVSNVDDAIDNIKSTSQFLNKTGYKNISVSIEKKYDKIPNLKFNELYTEAHSINKDKANKLLKHVYKQSLSVFDSMKEKVNDYNLRTLIDALSKNYETKFHKFVTETQNQNIKTHLGTQKVIFNTIEMSNGLLNRLTRLMLGDLENKGLLRNKMAVNIIEKEVNDVIRMEYRHACAKFGICHTNNTFSKFLTDLLTIVLKNNDAKLRQALDAIRETVKDNKFGSVMSPDMLNKFYKGIEGAEKGDTTTLRFFLTISRNIISNKYKPLAIVGVADERINKTVAFLNIIELFDKILPGNEINCLEWNDIKNSMGEWSDGKRDDILDIMQTLVDYLEKSIDRLDKKSVHSIRNYLKYFVS